MQKHHEVWPEGNEGLPPPAIFSMKGYMTNGLGLLTMNLSIPEIIAEEITEEPINKAFRNLYESFLRKPRLNKITGIPNAKGADELVKPL